MVRHGQVRKIHDLINTIRTNWKPKAKTHLSRHLFHRLSCQRKQTIPYLLMTTFKIAFYKNIKSVLVLVNHRFLILGGKRGILGFYSVRQIFFLSDSFSKLPDRMSDKLSQIFDMSITAVSFIGGGNQSTQRKPQKSCKSLTNFIT